MKKLLFLFLLVSIYACNSTKELAIVEKETIEIEIDSTRLVVIEDTVPVRIDSVLAVVDYIRVKEEYQKEKLEPIKVVEQNKVIKNKTNENIKIEDKTTKQTTYVVNEVGTMAY